MGNIRVHLIIHGLVQGVFFRDSTRRKARSLGISGWVRNRPEGTVEVVAEGPEETIDQFVAWCNRGPSGAEVIQVDEDRGSWSGQFDSFDIVH